MVRSCTRPVTWLVRLVHSRVDGPYTAVTAVYGPSTPVHSSCIQPCTRPIHCRVHGYVRIRVVYVYMTRYTVCTRPWPSSRHVHGRVQAVFTARTRPCNSPLRACTRDTIVYTAVHTPCTSRTRPCTRRVHGRVHGPYTYTAVYTSRVRTWPCIRPRRRVYGPYTLYSVYTAVFTIRTRPCDGRVDGP